MVHQQVFQLLQCTQLLNLRNAAVVDVLRRYYRVGIFSLVHTLASPNNIIQLAPLFNDMPTYQGSLSNRFDTPLLYLCPCCSFLFCQVASVFIAKNLNVFVAILVFCYLGSNLLNIRPLGIAYQAHILIAYNAERHEKLPAPIRIATPVNIARHCLDFFQLVHRQAVVLCCL